MKFVSIILEKIPFLYFFLHKSWIWQSLGHVTKKFSYCHFCYAPKECFWPKKNLNFMHGFKSATLAIFHFCQNGTFEPVHEIQNFFWPKAFFWIIMKMGLRKFFRNMSQGLPNPGFMQEKMQKGDFLRCPMMKIFFNPFFRFYTSRVHGFCRCDTSFNWENVCGFTNKKFIFSADSKYKKLTADIWWKKYFVIHKILMVWLPRMSYKKCICGLGIEQQSQIFSKNWYKSLFFWGGRGFGKVHIS